jgi:hypothetical protein
LQHTPLAQEPALQLTTQEAPPQLMAAGQLFAAQAMFVSCVAPLSIKFWQACLPLHSNKQELAASLQLSLLGQLFSPLQRTSHFCASQLISFLHEPCALHTTSHELPPQRMLPEQVFSATHCTEQVSASRQSMACEQAPGVLHCT